MELSRIDASAACTTARAPATGSGSAEAPGTNTNHPSAYGRVNPFNPCLPYTESRTCTELRRRQHRRPVRRLAELVRAQLVPSRTPPHGPGPAFVRALVVKGSRAQRPMRFSCPVHSCRGPRSRSLGAVALAWLGLLGFVFTDYEVEAAPAFDALAHGPSRSSSSLPRLRRLADHARAVRAGRGRAGRGTGRGLPRRRRAMPAGRLRARRRARREPARPRRRPRHGRDRGRAVRRQPDHAARARHRPPRGAARRRAVRRRGARGAARARDTRGRAARAGDGQQGMGRARRRAGAAGAARAPPARRWRSRGASRSPSCCRCCSPRRRAPSRAARCTPTRSSSRGRCGGSSARPAR